MSFGNFFDKLLFMKVFYKQFYKNDLLIFTILIFFSFPVFSLWKENLQLFSTMGNTGLW